MDKHIGKVIDGGKGWKWECNCAATSSGRTYRTAREALDRLNAHIERMK